MNVPRSDWAPFEQVGGQIDTVFAELRGRFAELRVERLSVARPTDDDNVWFIKRDRDGAEIQIDAHPHGEPPYYVEADDEAAVTLAEADDVVTHVARWLAL